MIKMSRRGVVVNVQDRNIIVCEFELQTCCYVQYRDNTHGKGMNFLFPQPAMV